MLLTNPADFAPSSVAATASEAHTCIAVQAYWAAVLLARSVIEATAKEKGISKGTLEQKIDVMHEKRLIRDYISDGAHEVRYFGNDMAHGDFVQDVSREDAGLALTLMDQVLEEVFQRPARVGSAPWVIPGVEKYAVVVRRAGWGHRIVRFCRWKPSTYRQVWAYAVLGFGVPGFCIWAVIGTRTNWLISSLIYAVSITFFSGLGQSNRLRRRTHRLDELKNLYEPALRFQAVPPVADDK